MSIRPDISVIITTYNLEDYVGTALESVLLQQGVSLEILVVDDHSSDDTVKIVQKYAQHYSHIHLLYNTKEKGVSGARHTGMERMQGQACFFLDGDDLLPPNALEPLMKYMRQHHVPLVRGIRRTFCQQRWLWIDEKKQKEQLPYTYPTEGFWQYLYDVKFLKEHGFYFPEKCLRGQDRVFFCQIFCKLNDFPVIDTPVYIYRINHKKIAMSARHTLSFVEHVIHVRQNLEAAQRMDFFPSYIQTQFCDFWLLYAHNAMQEGPEVLGKYLTACATLLAGKKEQLYPILYPTLQEQSDVFWKACEKNDTQVMLAALQNTGHLQALHPYIGISERMLQNHWPFFRLLRRIKNICTLPQSIRHLYYTYSLEKRSKEFCLKN